MGDNGGSFFSRTWGWHRISNLDLDDSDEAAEADDYDHFGTLVDTPFSDDEDDDEDEKGPEEDINLVELYVQDFLVDDKAEHALEMMWNLVCGKNDNTKVREQFAKCTNSADALVKAMCDRGTNVELQWKCCSLLIGLTFKQVKNKAMFNECGAADAVVATMKRFPFAEKIQQSGCGALRNLSSLKSHQQYVIEAGGIEAVVAAMSGFPEAARLQKCACDSLYNYANTVDTNRRLIIRKGGGVALAETQLLFECQDGGLAREVFLAATEALKVLNSAPVAAKPNGPVVKIR